MNSRASLGGAIAAAFTTIAFGLAPASAGLRFLPLPAALPSTAPIISIKADCPDRAAVAALFTRLKEGAASGDTALHRVVVKGTRYIAFRPKDVGVSLPVLMTCVDAYMGTEADATKAGLWIPGDDVPLGAMIFTPILGFYGDPRAWRALPKR